MIIGKIIDKVDRNFISFVYYSGLGNSVEAQYTEENVRGRSEPHDFYQFTSADVYNLSIQLVASYMEGDNRTAKDVHKDYLFLKSFQFPDYGENNIGPVKKPHEVIIKIGNYFRGEGTIRTPRFNLDSIVDEDGYPYVVGCEFTFKIHRPQLADYLGIRGGL